MVVKDEAERVGGVVGVLRQVGQHLRVEVEKHLGALHEGAGERLRVAQLHRPHLVVLVAALPGEPGERLEREVQSGEVGNLEVHHRLGERRRHQDGLVRRGPQQRVRVLARRVGHRRGGEVDRGARDVGVDLQRVGRHVEVEGVVLAHPGLDDERLVSVSQRRRHERVVGVAGHRHEGVQAHRAAGPDVADVEPLHGLAKRDGDGVTQRPREAQLRRADRRHGQH
eukprot:9247304-Pyramimonas_sp.AAC.1